MMLVAIAGLTLGACRTTHELGRFDDRATVTQLQGVVAEREAYAVVTPALGGRSSARVVAIGPEGARLALEPTDAPTVVSGTQLTYVSTYDRLRGARDGALIVGLPTLVAGAAAGAWLAANTTGCGCGDGDPSVPKWGLVFGAVSGIAGAVVGGGVGALFPHEDRYLLTARR